MVCSPDFYPRNRDCDGKQGRQNIKGIRKCELILFFFFYIDYCPPRGTEPHVGLHGIITCLVVCLSVVGPNNFAFNSQGIFLCCDALITDKLCVGVNGPGWPLDSGGIAS
jgi:hypothetical protein